MAIQNYAKQIATTIWNQIMSSAPNGFAVMAWGINGKAFGETPSKEPYLVLEVKGSRHKGFVRIVYHQCPDLYWIHLIDRKGNEKKVIDHVYGEDLFDAIDREVEKNWRPNELN